MSTSPMKSKPAAKSKASSLILYVVLAILIAALAYDYGVARPAVEEAYALIDEKSVDYDNDPDRVLTRETVGELMGRPADATFDNGTSTVDVYEWTSGLMFTTHDLYVSYKRSGENDVFFRLEKFGYDVEVPSEEAPVEFQTSTARAEPITEDGDDVSSFEALDLDGDGTLSIDEMPEAAEADTDGDGSVDEEEYDEFVRAIRTE